MSEPTARAIRIITLPPIMALFLIVLLKGYFPEGHDRMAIVLLCGLPLLSYLYWKAMPEQYAQGRTSQRKLAIIFSVVGYVLGLIYCLICDGSKAELLMYLSYVVCGGMIALSSFVFHVKSSGHAAGVTAPVMILTLWVNPLYLLGFLLMIPVSISSQRLGRHTSKELLLGCCYGIAATLILWLCIGR